MDQGLVETKERLEEEVKSYWEKYVKDEDLRTHPTSATVLMNNFAFVGLITGLSIGGFQQITNAMNVVSKSEGLPFFKDIPPVYQTRTQGLGRIILSGLKGGAVAGVYSCTYFLSNSFDSPNSINLFISGFTSGSMGGFICKYPFNTTYCI